MPDTSLDTQVTEHVEHFMRNLLNARMDVEETAKQGFRFCMETYANLAYEQSERISFAHEAMFEASKILLKVAQKLQIDKQSAHNELKTSLSKDSEK